MKKLLHYTSRERLAKIMESGFLAPNTLDGVKLCEQTEEFKRLVEQTGSNLSNGHYLVGIPADSLHKWEEYGLMGYLRKHTKMEVLLEAPIIGSEGFVREHVHLSPKRTVKLYGRDILTEFLDSPEFFQSSVRYINSTTSLKNYNGNFIVPEIWIPQRVPVDRLKITPINN